MERFISAYLHEWRHSKHRKPLLLRGARQVGKTYAVRQLGKQFDSFVEVNFEAIVQAKTIFAENLEPKKLIRDLSLLLDTPIEPGKTLLFLDEIQEAPQAIKALRYFYENLPDLHVIAAGSLLDFTLEQIGAPVGRVSFLYMYPLSFAEFLLACNYKELLLALLTEPLETFSQPLHTKLLNLYGQYMAVGGMPEAVKIWRDTNSLKQVSNLHQQLIEAYRQDFAKYAKKFQLKYVELIFNRIPQQLGQHLVYTNLSKDYKKRELEPCLELLEKAGVIHRAYSSLGQGIPLGAQASTLIFKPLFLDCALAQNLLGLPLKDWILDTQKKIINKGNISEAMIGQEILAYSDPMSKAQLYYWHRMARSSNAELDYLIQRDQHIIPLEVKSGKTGHLKSLHLFLETHPQIPYGIRLSPDLYHVHQKIQTYPIYALIRIASDDNQFFKKFVASI